MVIHFAGDSSVYQAGDFDEFCHLKYVPILSVLTMKCSKYGQLKIRFDLKNCSCVLDPPEMADYEKWI